MNEELLVFASDEISDNVMSQLESWRVLVVDDEPEIHHVTKMVLKDTEFDGRSLTFEFASSAREARDILQKDTGHDIAVALVDVVMETSHAGLDLIHWIRDINKNHTIRLILRTGQPGEAPEENVIRDYDINDYKNKTELTALRLKTSVFSALRSYRDIKIIERHRHGLERVLSASMRFIECETLAEFASTILEQIAEVLNIASSQIACAAITRDENNLNEPDFTVLAANACARKNAGDELTLPDNIREHIQQALHDHHGLHEADYFVGYFTTRRGTEHVLYVANSGPIDTVQHHLLSTFANNVAVAYENLRLRETIRESQRELSYVIGEAVEMRSKETGSHVKRVAHISYLLARHYGLNEEEAEMIKLASPLHDVGKVGIPDIVLNKPGRHEPKEAAIMRTHAVIGYEMLSKSENPILKLGAQIAHQHHECWDGSGYPRGLKGSDIAIAGRISAVADVFDALGSVRCYKPAWKEEEIIALFESQRGRQFEPKLVDILLEHFDEFHAIREMYPDPPSSR